MVTPGPLPLLLPMPFEVRDVADLRVSDRLLAGLEMQVRFDVWKVVGTSLLLWAMEDAPTEEG